jgi:hypothetical protein
LDSLRGSVHLLHMCLTLLVPHSWITTRYSFCYNRLIIFNPALSRCGCGHGGAPVLPNNINSCSTPIIQASILLCKKRATKTTESHDNATIATIYRRDAVGLMSCNFCSLASILWGLGLTCLQDCSHMQNQPFPCSRNASHPSVRSSSLRKYKDPKLNPNVIPTSPAN